MQHESASPPQQGLIAVRVTVLGEFHLSIDGRPVEAAIWRRKRQMARLVETLAISDSHRRPRDELSAILWPDLDRPAAANNLRVLLHTARRMLLPELRAYGASPILHTAGDLIELADPATTTIWTDAVEFERLATTALRTRDPLVATAALALYRGDLLPLAHDLWWTEAPRQRLRRLYRETLLLLARLRHSSGMNREAIQLLTTAFDRDPTDEPVVADLIAFLRAANRPGEATRVRERHVHAVRRELGIDLSTEQSPLDPPAVSPTEPARPVQARARFDTPISNTTPTAGHPRWTTPFVGRVVDLEQLAARLARQRLVTIVGPAGAGKTRLALEFAHRLGVMAKDGVCTIELADIANQEYLVERFANALGIVAEPGVAPQLAIERALQRQHRLLVVDNAEHLLPFVAPLVSDLLRSCPHIRCLVTSRAPLRLPGESVWPLDGLPVPPPDADAPDDIRQSDATRLFLEIAATRTPTLTLSRDTSSIIARICRRLDGLPLAIELAAHLVGTLPLREIDSRLDRLLPLLDIGRAESPGDRTMRSAIAWSVDLVSAHAASLLGTLAIFRNGMSLDGAERAAALEPGLASADFLRAFDELRRHSLVTVEDTPDGPRYRLLELVRQWAIDRLDPSALARARSAHANAMAAIGQQIAHALDSHRQMAALRQAAIELDNVRAALEWGLRPGGDPALSLALAAGLRRFWEVRWLAEEGRSWIERALALLPDLDEHRRAEGVNAAGVLSNILSDYDHAIALFAENTSRYRRLGDPIGEGLSLANRAVAARDRGDWSHCVELGLAALDLLEPTGHLAHQALTLHNLGVAYRELGDHSAALSVLHDGLSRASAAGHRHYIAAIRCRIAQVHLRTGDLLAASAFAAQSLDDYRVNDDPSGTAMAERTCGVIAYARGDMQGAWTFGNAALIRSLDHRIARQLFLDLEFYARRELDRASVAQAALALGKADALRHVLQMEHGVSDRLLGPADLTLLRHGAEQASWQRGAMLTFDEIRAWPAITATPPLHAPYASPSLTPREQQILQAMAAGRSSKEIAHELRISPRTVETHIARVRIKTGARSRRDLRS